MSETKKEKLDVPSTICAVVALREKNELSAAGEVNKFSCCRKRAENAAVLASDAEVLESAAATPVAKPFLYCVGVIATLYSTVVSPRSDRRPGATLRVMFTICSVTFKDKVLP